MIFERITQSSPLEIVVNIMMLYLFLSLFASQLYLVTPCAIKIEQVEHGEKPPSLEVNKTTSEFPDPKTADQAPWTYGVSTLENTEHENDTCQRVGLFVSFKELGLYEDIVAPPGFQAYQCKGKCSLTERKKFPNRSPLMALLEEKKGIKIADETCCVPTKLRPITVLYMNKNTKVVLRNIDDMVVEECGCE